MADPDAVREVIGIQPGPDPGKCERALYKRMLDALLGEAGAPVSSDPMEYAPDFVRATDLYRASKRQPSLGAFIDELRAALRGLAAS